MVVKINNQQNRRIDGSGYADNLYANVSALSLCSFKKVESD